MEQTKPLELAHMHHVSRQTRRLEESRRFYVEVLGFREVSRPPFDFAGAWLYQAGMQVHLIEAGEEMLPVDEGINTRGNHIAFQVGDLEEMVRRLEAHGVAYVRRELPERGWPQVYFRDPDGHLVEIGMYGEMDR